MKTETAISCRYVRVQFQRMRGPGGRRPIRQRQVQLGYPFLLGRTRTPASIRFTVTVLYICCCRLAVYYCTALATTPVARTRLPEIASNTSTSSKIEAAG
jgi:hypothetical protein